MPLAYAIPGDSMIEGVFVGGTGNFLSIYNVLITARVLLSWFPQAMGVPALRPVFAVTDPYLNLFRGLIPPIMGLDLSILPAFLLLDQLGNAVGALGAELPRQRTAAGALRAQAAAPRRRVAVTTQHPLDFLRPVGQWHPAAACNHEARQL